MALAKTLDVFADTSAACEYLAERHKPLARAVAAIGTPHIRRRPGGFEALFRIIIEQQVSVASAQAIWRRCQDGIDQPTPQNVLRLGEEKLRTFGLSRPKAHYVSQLAARIETGDLDFDEIAKASDDAAANILQSIKGIGPWTAAIYLLFCEGRIDIWPPRDVALLGAYRAAQLRGPKADMERLDKKAAQFAPYRGIAAHILWTYYAHIRGRTPI